MQKYIILDFATTKTIEVISTNKFAVFLIVLFIIMHFISYRKQSIVEKIARMKLGY